MSERVSISADDLPKAAASVNGLQHAAELSALVYDVLTRQAEGRTLFAGEKFIAGRAEAHAVSREAADTPLGNVVAILERGPDGSGQWALLSALYVHGFGRAAQVADARRNLTQRLAEHCDFLELDSPYKVLPLIERMLDPHLAGDVHQALGELVLRDDRRDADPRQRARNAGRIATLAGAHTAAARSALQAIHARAQDPFSRALSALALGQSAPSSAPPLCVRGRSQRFPPSGVRAVLQWLSGLALLGWLGRLVLLVAGVRRDVEVELSGSAVRVRRTMLWLGRVTRTVEQVQPLSRLVHARRAARFRSLNLLLGALSLALGLLLAGIFAADALRIGDASLLGFAALFLLAGCALDLLLDVLVPAGSGRVFLELDFGRGNRFGLAAVPRTDADRMLELLQRRLAENAGVSRAVA